MNKSSQMISTAALELQFLFKLTLEMEMLKLIWLLEVTALTFRKTCGYLIISTINSTIEMCFQHILCLF